MSRPVVMFLLLGLQACGAMGGTKPFTLEIEQAPDTRFNYLVEVATVDVIDGANEVDSVGTFHVGKMDKGELADLADSLTSTLETVNWPSAETVDAKLRIHLLVSHYYVAHSNNDGAVLAAVDWALATPANEVVFAEQFFTSVQGSDIEGINTLGRVKNLLNASIVQRVAEKRLLLAANVDRAPDIEFPHTYSTVQQAAAPLPKRLTSVLGLPSFSTKSVDWTQNAPTEPVDWSRYLTRY